MKKVFICSPLRGDVEQNQQRAREHCADAVIEGYLPLAPHLIFTQFLDDNNVADREAGIQMGLELMEMCDEMWVYGSPTEGMKIEIKCWEDNFKFNPKKKLIQKQI